VISEKPGEHQPFGGFKSLPRQYRPNLRIPKSEVDYTDPALKLQHFITEHGIKTLNVAGSRESKEPGIWKWVYKAIDDAFFWGESHPCMLGGPGEG